MDGSMDEFDTVPVDTEVFQLYRQRMAQTPPRGVTVDEDHAWAGIALALIIMAIAAVVVNIAAGLVF